MRPIFPLILAALIATAPIPATAVGGLDDTANAPAATATMASQLDALSAQGDYAAMLDLLDTATGADDPILLNYRGYALRKTGHPDEAIAAYRKALALDPDLHQARAYMGLGLLDLGDTAAARAELLEIRTRGGRGTLAYITLKNAILDKTGY